MKSVVILCVLSLVVMALGERVLYSRGCIYINVTFPGDSECEIGTRTYTTGCGFLKPEATCENPTPVEDRTVKICDFSACYCEPPTVRYTPTNECIPLEECPKE